jgi:hypothetical protein
MRLHQTSPIENPSMFDSSPRTRISLVMKLIVKPLDTYPMTRDVDFQCREESELPADRRDGL